MSDYPCVCGYVFAARWEREDHYNTANDGLQHGQPVRGGSVTNTQQPTPEDVIASALKELGIEHTTSQWTAVITQKLVEAGYEILDPNAPPETPKGEDLTAGAGPDDTCGCGEPITMYDGEWLHIYNEDLRGTGDHEPKPW